MKKTLALILTVLMAFGLFSPAAPASAETGEPLHVVTTIFPEYDWVRTILGERAAEAELRLLLDKSVDLHSYQPTVDDIVAIASCDLFVYVGGESDEWVEDALEESANPDRIVINLLEVLGESVKEEETVEGMEAEHDHDHDEDHDEDHHHDEGEVEYDEHVWLSLRNATVLCEAIAEALAQLDPAGAESYRANAEAYAKELAVLDAAYQAAVDEAPVKTLLFGDRFPFRYLVDDYGLDYYAAFAGCSAETEASFETIVFLANKIDELGLNAVCQIESADGSIARTIRDNARTREPVILSFDSMQSTTSEDMAAGASYLSIMEQNLAVLKEALK